MVVLDIVGSLRDLVKILDGERAELLGREGALTGDEREFAGRVQEALPLLGEALEILERGVVPTQHDLTEEEAALADARAAASPAELARAILAGGRVRFASRHASGVEDDATADKQMVATASGRKATRSSYGNAPGGKVMLSARMLRSMLRLSGEFRLSVSEIAGGSHSVNSRHYAGIAFDVTHVNGVRVAAGATHWRRFLASARELGATETLGPGQPGHATHVHVAWPRSGGRADRGAGADAGEAPEVCEVPEPGD
jgi:hypothetical protein